MRASSQRAIQDLRREAGLDLDDRIELWVDGLAEAVAAHLAAVADGHARRPLASGAAPAGAASRPAGRRSTAGTVDDRPRGARPA